MNNYLGIPADPFRQTLATLLYIKPEIIPVPIGTYCAADLEDGQYFTLQNWLGNHLPKSIQWSTHIGIIEAVDHIVAEAVHNGNIPDKSENPYTLLT